MRRRGRSRVNMIPSKEPITNTKRKVRKLSKTKGTNLIMLVKLLLLKLRGYDNEESIAKMSVVNSC